MHAHTNKECNKIISDTSKTFLRALVTAVVPSVKLDPLILKSIFVLSLINFSTSSIVLLLDFNFLLDF